MHSIERESQMLAGKHERHPCELADRHMRKDLVVKRQVAAALWFFYGLSPAPPAVKVRLRLKHLRVDLAHRSGE
ncbi:hypothetical protein OHB24_23885 [Kribbella sp. NBC_00482]|uniref:hypothetical protein n=1 Tax=Kribbella sp. NBC_00482 TaxID=2975968 RepID=UPI002E1866F2